MANITTQLQGGPLGSRALGDVDATRKLIYDNALEAAKNLAPVSNQKYTLRLTNPAYEGPEGYTKAEEKQAIMEGRSLGRRLRGTWVLHTNDPVPQIVDQRKVTVASVPHMTPRGTFIVNGNEFSLSHQMRLRPGIFTRVKESGELESHVNVAKGFGHRYFLDPETSIFRAQFGQSRMPLLPILKALGARDAQIRDAWGNDIYAANVVKDEPGTLRKLFKKLTHKNAPESDAELHEAINKAFKEMELDPEVTLRTLGTRHKNVDPEVILRATRKLVAVNKGEAETDDRDAMAFQKTLGPEDLIAERFHQGLGKVRVALWRATLPGNLKRMPPSVLDDSVRAAILKSGLGNPLEGINNAEFYDQRSKVTRMGAGGITSSDSVPDEARMLQPSHLGFVDPSQVSEGGNVGVDTRISTYTLKGNDGRLYARFLNPRTKRLEWKAPQDVADSVVAFPGELESKEPFVRVQYKGKLQYVPRDKVDYQLNHMTEAFGPMSSMVPLKQNSFGQRVSMGARFLTQALPVVDAEAPLVQSGIPGTDESFESAYGEEMGAARSKVDGTVLEVTPDYVKVKDANGQLHYTDLYNNYPNARKTFIHNTPLVRIGQSIKAGDLIARSNFTDDKGVTALGKNARVAFMPYKGHNFEDAVVMSESFAKKMTSEHMYQHELDLAEGVKASKNAFVSIYPGKLTKEQLAKYDEHGVIKPGQTVEADEPVILAVKERQTGPRLGRRKSAWADASVFWEHHAPGTVTDISRGKNGISVIVKALNPTEVGDKFSGRYGNKGIASAIVPDEDMPRSKDGQPFELLLNPLGIISRGNPSVLIEAQLGKIAKLTGKPYKMVDFDSAQDMREFAEKELAKHGLTDTEDVIDPKTGRAIKGVNTGYSFILKLHHLAESKLQGRATGGYSNEGAPSKGGSEGSKRVGLLDSSAILSHGAYNVLHDASIIRGQRNEDYWRQLMSGYTPPNPKVPFIYQKFMSSLQAAGINPVKQGTRTQLMAMTNKTARALTEDRAIQNADTVDWRVHKLSPMPGGLFDQALTGGHSGTKWAHIPLAEPMPNPIMEEPIRHILGLTQQQFEDALAGKADLPGREGFTGPSGIAQALEGLDLDKEIARAKAEIAGGKKTYRDKAIRRLQYLKGAKAVGQHPKDWIMDRVPVIPPAFRPVSTLGDSGTPVVPDANYQYKELWDANQNFKAMSEKSSDLSDERLAVYNSFKGITGLGDPITPELKDQDVKGILAGVFGSSPKYGCFDDATEILSENGWVKFADLAEGTSVATLNPASGAFEWQVPSGVFHWDYTGDLFWFGTKHGLDCVVTPNHRNWVRYRNRDNVADIEAGWRIERAYITAANSNRKWFRTAASAWVGHRKRPKFLPKTCKLVDFAAFVGWWTAEGWLGDRKRDCIQLCQAVKQEDKCKEIDRLVQALGFRFSVGTYYRSTSLGKTTVRQWSIRSKELAEWLEKNVRSGAANKKLSAKIRDWDTSYLKAFFIGYLDGDGTRRYLPRRNGGGVTHKNSSNLIARHQNAHTVSTSLADDLQEITCKLGVTARLKWRPNCRSVRPICRVKLSGSRFVVMEGKKNHKVINYTGQVHCVSVPNGIIYVRRNGKPFFSGNTVQRKLLGSTVDLVGRATISPNPNLDMDQVGIPIEKAWTLYQPFIVRRLVRRGLGKLQAMEAVKDRTPAALKEMQEEMKERPVIINRAPVLHRYGLMAAWPQLTSHNVLEIPPLVVGGFGADFDGDAMQFHVPASEAAVKDAIDKMLPSKNLFAVKDFDVHYLPTMEYVGGLWAASTHHDKKAPTRTFRTKKDALAAYRRGDIGVGTPVEILEN